MEEKEKTTEENPNMTKMCLEYFRQTKPSNEKDFYNTTMQLNRNYSARLRADKNLGRRTSSLRLTTRVAGSGARLDQTSLV